MRDIENIWTKWDTGNGEFVGDNRPIARVTVEKDYYLNYSDANVGLSNRGPFRWYQRCDNSQVETEIPNIQSIQIQRSIDSDAATATIQIYNMWHEDFGDQPSGPIGQLGMPGYLGPDYGASADAAARWGQTANEWARVLTPNALIRTYEGFGGFLDTAATPSANQDELKVLADAIADGDTMLTGVWLIDRVTTGTNGTMTLTCRDMAKLLIDQMLYPPLIPTALYPLQYCRYYFDQTDEAFDPRPPRVQEEGVTADVPLIYKTSSGDKWYGQNAAIHGHRPTDSLDGNPETFAYSVGNGHPTRPFCTDYFEYEPQGAINQVYLHTWKQGYTVYINVKENGVWQGETSVAYDVTPLYTSQPSALNPDTEADELYVLQTGVASETGFWITLPRVYDAERLRITFKQHYKSNHGPFFYRCGIRELKARIDTNIRTEDKSIWHYDMAPVPGGDGYYVVDHDSFVYAFGDAREQPYNPTTPNRYGGGETRNTIVIAIVPTSTNLGYWVLQSDGQVLCFGDAEWYGDGSGASGLIGDKRYMDMAAKFDDSGYWILGTDGSVEAFSATNYGDVTGVVTVYRAIESHPTLDGYWIADQDGTVTAYGSAPNHGSIAESLIGMERITEIQSNGDGSGYWLLGLGGTVFAVGAATNYGEPQNVNLQLTPDGQVDWAVFERYSRLAYGIVPTEFDDGYWVMQTDGQIHIFGAASWYGQPGGAGTQRRDGNYQDYSDIVKELCLWAGFWCQEDAPAGGQEPVVYGNIEATGIHAGTSCISEDLFDKRPVIEAINELKEIVGYIFRVDDQGAIRFESPNWWAAGNFYEDGAYTSFIPDIDESLQLTDYSVSQADDSIRSEIIIGSQVPDPTNQSTVNTRIVPRTSSILRGMVKPAIWTNEVFSNGDEQKIMAELIALHIWFQQRIGSVTCLANPNIQINDQVRISERNSGEAYIHYVRSISRSLNMDSGEYMMTLETHWLGDGEEWVITRDDLLNEQGLEQLGISVTVQDFLRESSSPSVQQAVLNNFESGQEGYQPIGPDIEDGDTGTEGGGPGA